MNGIVDIERQTSASNRNALIFCVDIDVHSVGFVLRAVMVKMKNQHSKWNIKA